MQLAMALQHETLLDIELRTLGQHTVELASRGNVLPLVLYTVALTSQLGSNALPLALRTVVLTSRECTVLQQVQNIVVLECCTVSLLARCTVILSIELELRTSELELRIVLKVRSIALEWRIVVLMRIERQLVKQPRRTEHPSHIESVRTVAQNFERCTPSALLERPKTNTEQLEPLPGCTELRPRRTPVELALSNPVTPCIFL